MTGQGRYSEQGEFAFEEAQTAAIEATNSLRSARHHLFMCYRLSGSFCDAGTIMNKIEDLLSNVEVVQALLDQEEAEIDAETATRERPMR